MDAPIAPRRRVLIGAYACGPVEEPEAGAGWGFATAAARDNDVWVFTRRRFEPAVRAALEADPELAEHLKVIHIDLSDRVMALRKHGWSIYWYYSLWQRLLAREATRLHAETGFDVAHHVTFANDWMPCGLAGLPGDVPLVWGPVGGASHLPYWRMREWLGRKGLVTEVIRGLTSIPRRIWGDRTARRSSLMIGQNDDVTRRFASLTTAVTEPNASLDDVPLEAPPRPARTGPKVAVYAGRLIGLKGVRLALDVIARTRPDEWRFDIYGEGYDRDSLIAHAQQSGISDRVRFLGHRPRGEVLAAFESADAMLFMSMHDQAGWVAGEASSLGCPVVCLPLGGPPLLAERNAFVASLDGDIVGNVVRQLRLAGEKGGVRHNRWSSKRLTDLVNDWYDRAIEEGPRRR